MAAHSTRVTFSVEREKRETRREIDRHLLRTGVTFGERFPRPSASACAAAGPSARPAISLRTLLNARSCAPAALRSFSKGPRQPLPRPASDWVPTSSTTWRCAAVPSEPRHTVTLRVGCRRRVMFESIRRVFHQR